MQKKPWRKLTLLVLLAAALCYCVLAVNGVGNQLQYLIEAPAYEAAQDSGDSDAQKTLPNKRLKELSESLDLVVQLEAWDPTKNYQRTGLENEYYDILGVSIPSTSIPVSPGRNLAVVLETAAINNRQKKMGYNAARELLIRLGLDDKMD